jgi:hypothetical protein
MLLQLSRAIVFAFLFSIISVVKGKHLIKKSVAIKDESRK